MKHGKIAALFMMVLISIGAAGGCSDGKGGGDGMLGGDDPGAPAFDLDAAIELGMLSLVAYEQRLQCISGGKSAITVPDGYTLQEVIFEGVSSSFNDTCEDDDSVIPIAFIATKGDAIYLAFRGTSNVADVLSDVAAVQEDYNYLPDSGMVSGGFQGTYEGTMDNPIESAIKSRLNELSATGMYSTLYITGHSLGAALAVVAFPDLSVNLSPAIGTVINYNFASPLVGDSDFSAAYEALYGPDRVSVRILNTNDFIPTIPPGGLDCAGFMFVHVSGDEEITFGTSLPPQPDYASADCDLITIGTDVLTYGIDNMDAIEENHSMCTYFKTFCNMGADTSMCDQMAVGCDDGNANP